MELEDLIQTHSPIYRGSKALILNISPIDRDSEALILNIFSNRQGFRCYYTEHILQ